MFDVSPHVSYNTRSRDTRTSNGGMGHVDHVATLTLLSRASRTHSAANEHNLDRSKPTRFG